MSQNVYRFDSELQNIFYVIWGYFTCSETPLTKFNLKTVHSYMCTIFIYRFITFPICRWKAFRRCSKSLHHWIHV